jgi:hypothetical protein
VGLGRVRWRQGAQGGGGEVRRAAGTRTAHRVRGPIGPVAPCVCTRTREFQRTSRLPRRFVALRIAEALYVSSSSPPPPNHPSIHTLPPPSFTTPGRRFVREKYRLYASIDRISDMRFTPTRASLPPSTDSDLGPFRK